MAATAGAAGVQASGILLGQLMAQEAERRKQKREMEALSALKGGEMQGLGAATTQKGTASGLRDLMAAYGRALL